MLQSSSECFKESLDEEEGSDQESCDSESPNEVEEKSSCESIGEKDCLFESAPPCVRETYQILGRNT